MKHVALLRGTNVGKGARVPMGTLKPRFEGLGLDEVVACLNSGNVLFRSRLSAPEVTGLLEDEFERAFGESIPTLVKTAAEVITIAAAIPGEWGSGAGEQTCVAYLFGDVDEPGLVDELPVKKQFMRIFHTPGAIVWNIKREDYNRSQITKIVAH